MGRGRMRRRKKNRKSPFVIIFILFLLIGVAGFIYISPLFEREPPKINIKQEISANGKTPIIFTASDNVGLKSVEVVLKSNGSKFTVYKKNFISTPLTKKISLLLPKAVIASNIHKWDIKIIATDSSFWNLLMGNKTTFRGTANLDNKPPKVSIIAKSPSILKGGSALVIYKVVEKDLNTTYIDSGNGFKFKPIRYKKNGVYATLIVWPFDKEHFSPKIIAVDNANNKTIFPLHMRPIFKKFRTSKVQVKDKFIDGKISQLAARNSAYSHKTDRIKKFKFVNELMRKRDDALIRKYTKRVAPLKNHWNLKAFHPLHRAKKVSHFGIHRFYYYKTADNIISTSRYLGYALASIKHDNIYAPTDGKVVFVGDNGIYGNMVIIDHGFGLYTMYGHCSKILVKKGDTVKSGQIFAKTGQSGLALGDHLHFGVSVQGVEVYPMEWMKKKWINNYIFATFQKADTILGYN